MSIPLYEPLNTLKKVDQNIWIVDGDSIAMDFGLFDVPFSTRMTIVKLEDDSLWCHSPIKPTEELLEEINRLGEVNHLISPNKLHYAYIKEWKSHYPKATAWASPRVEERAASQDIPVAFDRSLENNPSPEWANSIDQLIFKGSRVIEEVVFFHKESHTLILTDLIENFEPGRMDNVFLRNISKIAGITHPDGQMPVDMRITFWGQKDQAKESFQQMLSWQPERILLAHGRWYDKNGTEELKQAFRWLE